MWNSPMYHIRLRTKCPHGDIWSQRNSLSAAKTKLVSLRHALGACSPRQFQSQIRRVPSQLHLPCNPLQCNAPLFDLPQQSKLLKDNVQNTLTKLMSQLTIDKIDVTIDKIETIDKIDVTIDNWQNWLESTLRTMFDCLRQISSKPRHCGSCTAWSPWRGSSTPSDVRSQNGSSRTHRPHVSSAAAPPPMAMGTGTPRCLASYSCRRSPCCHRAHSYEESCLPWLRSIESNWSNWHNWQGNIAGWDEFDFVQLSRWFWCHTMK